MNKIVEAVPLPGGYLQVGLQDGWCGEFDVNPYMESDFIAQLKDETCFSKDGVFFSEVGWPDGQDLGADMVVANLRVNKPLPH